MSSHRTSLLVAALALCVAACDSVEDLDGARGSCASGGALAGCPDSARTIEDACWRLVECGSYPLEAINDDGTDCTNCRDYGQCVDRLESMIEQRARVVVACVVSSTCDELKAPGSPTPYADPACFDYGDR